LPNSKSLACNYKTMPKVLVSAEFCTHFCKAALNNMK